MAQTWFLPWATIGHSLDGESNWWRYVTWDRSQRLRYWLHKCTWHYSTWL